MVEDRFFRVAREKQQVNPIMEISVEYYLRARPCSRDYRDPFLDFKVLMVGRQDARGA